MILKEGVNDMTEQEAINFFKKHKTSEKHGDLSDFGYKTKGAYEVSIKALEKQIPKKPIPGGLYSCPNCEKLLGYGAFEPKGLYCKNCGQKLDWGDEDAID